MSFTANKEAFGRCLLVLEEAYNILGINALIYFLGFQRVVFEWTTFGWGKEGYGSRSRLPICLDHIPVDKNYVWNITSPNRIVPGQNVT